MNENRDNIHAPLATGAFVLLGLLVMAYTGYHNWQTLALVSSPIWAWVGLALFEGGAVAWAYWFSYRAAQLQRPIALVASATDMVLCITSAVIHIMMSEKLQAAPEWAKAAIPWVLGLAVMVNAGLMWLAHMTDPEVMRRNELQDIEDDLQKEALRQTRERAMEHAARIGATLSTRMHDSVEQRLLGNAGIGKRQTPAHTPTDEELAFEAARQTRIANAQERFRMNASVPADAGND
jgi:signal transduction histidine kinase